MFSLFDAVKTKNMIVEWIREWFHENGEGCNAVIGISGGKDSSVVAALCVEALGKDKVIGVLMPNNTQSDINYSHEICDFLGIKNYVIDIGLIVETSLNIMNIRTDFEISDQTKINFPPRLRMSILYAISQSVNGRVSNNCNLSEDYVGYSTRYGDSVGDFSPISNLTVTEVKQIGLALGLPSKFIEKTPSDGLCGKTDEDNLGFSYDVLDKYIRTGVCEDKSIKERIDYLHEKNKFKLRLMDSFII